MIILCSGRIRKNFPAGLPGGMPDLMISYTDADYAEHRLLLSESGAEGEPVLVDDTIQAVG